MSDQPPANLLYEKEKWDKEPAGPKIKDGFRRWQVPVFSTFQELASDVQVDSKQMSEEDLADFNFDTAKLPGPKRKGGIIWYLTNYAGFMEQNGQVFAPGQSNEWLWVPGNAVIDQDQGLLEEKQTRRPPPPPPPPGPAPTKGAARSQGQPKAVTTVDQNYLPGDVLLSEHAGDVFIQQMTLAWPTHAGICVDPSTDDAVDANVGRGSAAVETTDIWDEFFHEDKTPGGGLVYRYDGGSDPGANKKAGADAAKWAQAQVGKEYHFSLKSPILGGTRSAPFSVPEKKFDKDGKAVDAKGKPLMMKDAKTGKEKHKQHDIYCAELVWRAYRFGAGVTLVDPKKFFNMYEHTNRTLVGILSEFATQAELDKIKQLRLLLRASPSVLARNIVIKLMRLQHPGYLCGREQFGEWG